MGDLIKITDNNGNEVVSARDLHAVLENKDNVNTWFIRQANRAMLVEDVDFTRVAFLQPSGQTSMDYAVNVNSAKELAMLNGGNKGKEVRQYFIEREKLSYKPQLKLPQTFGEALRALADATDREEQALLNLSTAKETIEVNKPKVVFAESVIGSANSILVRQFAKDLCDGGFEIGQNRLFQWFRQRKYLNKDNEPYQEYVAQGLFEVITRSIGSGVETFTTKTTKITGKGAVYFANKIKTT